MGPAHLPPLGVLLRRHRLEAGLTQEQLAGRSGVSARTISDLERGLERHSRRDTLKLLAEALALSDPERADLESVARQHLLPTMLPLHGLSTAKRRTAFPPLIGRTRELALLERHLADQGPPVQVLAGEPGIGKTRLLGEVAERGRAQGWAVVHGGCQRRSGQEPYAPLLEALNRSLAQRSAARLKLGLQGCSWLVRLLPELAETSVVPVPQWLHPPEQERRLMFAAVRRYLVNIAGPSGTLLVLDDLQWAGQDALDLLAALVRAPDERVGGELRVVAAYRSTEVRPADPLGQLLTDLAREELSTPVELGPLVPEAAAALLMALLADLSGDADELCQRLVRRADGVPFFLVSCALAVHSEAYGEPQGDAADVTDDQLPWTVAQSIRQRIALLPEASRDLLSIVAVSGRQAAIPVLLAVATRTGQNRTETLAALERTCHEGLLVEELEVRYAFSHDLIREVVAGDLGAARRASLHQWVAEAIVQSTPASREQRVAELAWHFARGGEPERALPYAIQAGEQAEAVYAHAEAEGHYRIALDLARELGDQRREAEVLEKLADVLYGVAQIQEMLALLESAAALQRAAGNLDQYAWDIAHMTRPYLIVRQGDVVLARLRALLTFLATQADAGDDVMHGRQLQPEGIREAVPEAIRPADPAASAAPSDSLAELAARAVPLLSARTSGHLYYSLTNCVLMQGRPLEAVPLGECAVLYAQAAGDRWLQVRTHWYLALALQNIGQPAKALRVLETASLVAQEANDLEGLAFIEGNRGDILFNGGAFAEGLLHERQALVAAEHYGMPETVEQVLEILAWMCLYTGDWDQALDYCRRATEVARSLLGLAAFHSASAGIALRQGTIQLARGEAQLAQKCLAEAIQKGDFTVIQAPAHAALAEAELVHGDAAVALARLEPWLERISPYEQAATGLVPLVAWACLELGEVERAATLLAECLAHAREQQYHLLLADALRIQALLALRQGRWQDAEAALDEALALARPMPYPYAEAKALYVYGDLHAACGEPERARERYEAALAILDRLGERLYAEHVEWALGELQHH